VGYLRLTFGDPMGNRLAANLGWEGRDGQPSCKVFVAADR
jgi:hypothetical protein